MTRTRTLLVVGVFIVSVAVLAAYDWQQQDTTPAESGQAVSGSLNKKDSVVPAGSENGTVAQSTTAPAEQTPEKMLPESKPAAEGVFVPLDNGTLRGESGSKLDVSSPSGVAMSSSAEKAPEQTTPDTSSASAAPQQQQTPEQAAPSQPSKTHPTSTAQKTPSQKTPSQKTQSPKTQYQASQAEKAAPASGDKGTAAVKEKSAPASKAPVVVTTKAPQKPGLQTIIATKLEVGEKIRFIATGDGPIQPKAMLLHNPERYVVDLKGRWSIRLPKIPQGTLLKAIRVGYREDSTRLVFDLSGKPAGSKVHTSGNTMDVELH